MSDFLNSNWKFFAGAITATILTSMYYNSRDKNNSDPM